MDIKGAAAIVTGGASGLGAATARALAAAGAKVAIFDVNADAAQAVASEIGGVGLECNVTSSDAAEAAIAAAREAHGAARVLVNCAGIGPPGRAVSRRGPLPLDDFRKIIEINLIGTFNCARLAAAEMLELDPVNDDGERGLIVNTSSVAAYDGQIGQPAYAASKGGHRFAHLAARAGIRLKRRAGHDGRPRPVRDTADVLASGRGAKSAGRKASPSHRVSVRLKSTRPWFSTFVRTGCSTVKSSGWMGHCAWRPARVPRRTHRRQVCTENRRQMKNGDTSNGERPPSAADIEAMAQTTYDSLPDAFRAQADNLVIQVTDFPDAETMTALGVDNEFELLGLYRGISLDQRSVLDAPDEMDIIFLYRRPILDYWCETGDSLTAIVRNVLIHEIGHHFGLSDADMEMIEHGR